MGAHSGDVVRIPAGTRISDIVVATSFWGTPIEHINEFVTTEDMIVRLGIVGTEIFPDRKVRIAFFGKAGSTYEVDKLEVLDIDLPED